MLKGIRGIYNDLSHGGVKIVSRWKLGGRLNERGKDPDQVVETPTMSVLSYYVK